MKTIKSLISAIYTFTANSQKGKIPFGLWKYFLLLWIGFPGVVWGEEKPSVLAIETEVYPNGLYPGVSPKVVPDGGGFAPFSAGGFEVLASLHNVTGLLADAAEGDSTEGGYLFRNIRIASDQTSFDDYLNGYFTFNLATQQLTPTRFERAPAVGIYEIGEKFLLKDNPDPIHFHTNPSIPNQFGQGSIHTFQSDTDYFINLTAGQRLCFVLTNFPLNRLYRSVILMEDGGTFIDSRTNTSNYSSLTYTPNPVLVSGKYRFRLEAVSPSTPFSFGIRFYNENSLTTTTVSSGDTLSASLGGSAGGYGLPYKKFKVRVNSGQTVSLPGDFDTYQYLINDRGSRVGGGTNSGINTTVTSNGDYYIVITPRDSVASSSEFYSGLLTISDSLGFQDWAWSHQLAYGHDGPKQDADGDGMENLLEYALGMNPVRSDAASATQLAVGIGQLTLSYNRPVYLRNVAVQPAFSTNLRTWADVTPAATGSVDGVTRMGAVFPHTENKAFGHIRVTEVP